MDVYFIDSSVTKIPPRDQARPTGTLIAVVFLEQPSCVALYQQAGTEAALLQSCAEDGAEFT